MKGLRRERECFGPRSVERQGEPGEHGQVGVEGDSPQATDAERGEGVPPTTLRASLYALRTIRT